MVLMGCFSTGKDAKEALIKADSMKRQCKMASSRQRLQIIAPLLLKSLTQKSFILDAGA